MSSLGCCNCADVRASLMPADQSFLICKLFLPWRPERTLEMLSLWRFFLPCVDQYSLNCQFDPGIASFSLLIVLSALQRPGDSLMARYQIDCRGVWGVIVPSLASDAACGRRARRAGASWRAGQRIPQLLRRIEGGGKKRRKADYPVVFTGHRSHKQWVSSLTRGLFN